MDCLGSLRVSVSLNSDLNLIEDGASGYTTLIGHQGAVNTCHVAKNIGTVLTTGSDGRVLEWSQDRARVVAVSMRRCYD